MDKLTNLKKLRKDHKITQKEIADQLGISFSGYWGYENGTRNIPLDMLPKIADFYNVSIDYLLNHKTVGPYNLVIYTDEEAKNNYDDSLTDVQRELIQQLISFFKEQNKKNK